MTTSPAPADRHRAGFTLLETMMALAVIALVASLVLPSALPGRGAPALRAEAFAVATLLRADRNAAVRSGRAVLTRVDLAGRRVGAGASGAVLALDERLALRLTSQDPRGVVFSADGTATAARLAFVRGEDVIAVDVNPHTAAVTLATP